MAIRSNHYTAAGVNIDAGDDLVRRIRPLADATRIAGAGAGLGGFGAVFDLAAAGFAPGSPRLVSGTDGVGTKLRVAFLTGRHSTIGIDCVAMCVNDIVVTGARPLLFLDYFATGRLEPGVGAAVVAGVAEGCRQAGCWLAGGETAEMPGSYPDGEYDLAGFAVGAVEPSQEILPSHTRAGDVVIACASTGLHSNGYSLARRVLLERAALPLDAPLGDDRLTLGERLLVPTRIYARTVAALQSAGLRPHALAHITGGGLWENAARSIDDALAIEFDARAVRAFGQPIFGHIARLGEVPAAEMYRVFNMGIGLLVTTPEAQVDATLEALVAAGEHAAPVGRLVAREEVSVRFDDLAALGD